MEEENIERKSFKDIDLSDSLVEAFEIIFCTNPLLNLDSLLFK